MDCTCSHPRALDSSLNPASQTGFSYETLNCFHRWVARIIFILMFVHIGGRTYVNDPPVNPTLLYSRYQVSGDYPRREQALTRSLLKAWGIAATEIGRAHV